MIESCEHFSTNLVGGRVATVPFFRGSCPVITVSEQPEGESRLR